MNCSSLVKLIIISLAMLICSITLYSQPNSDIENCTIGIAVGRATSDGRPMIWKTADGSGLNRVVQFNTSENFNFICDNFPGRSGKTCMGLNEKGFGIVESNAPDLVAGITGYDNFSFLWQALGSCATIEDFENFLDSTNVTGRRTYANYALIDTTGAAVLFETDGNQYWKFDVNDTIIAPDGYLIRANFSITGGGNAGIDRFNRSSKLIADFHAGDSLNYKSILRYQMRDFSDWQSVSIPVPYPYQWDSESPFGYFYTGNSICNSASLSSGVIQGVLPGEATELSTMWEILGQPATAITVPFWVAGPVPVLANNIPTAKLSVISNCIEALLFDYAADENYLDSYKLRDEDGNGLWAVTFPAEDSILSAAEEKLQEWRTSSFSKEEMLIAESDFAQYAYSKLRSAHDLLLTFTNANIYVSKVYSSYNDIIPDSLLSSGDDSQSVIKLPFLFQYDGVKYDKIQVSTNGWLEFGFGEAGSDSGLSTPVQLSYVGAPNNDRLAKTNRPNKTLAPWWDDLSTGSEGNIGYKIEGLSPDRKVIIQWKNMQAYSNGSTTLLNFQIHLEESSNNIEFQYGPVINGTYTGDGASIGFKDLSGGSLRFYDIKSKKICFTDELISNLSPLTDWPGVDSCYIIKTYTSTTPTTIIVSNLPNKAHLAQNYPNPFNPSTTISFQLPVASNVELTVFNLLGQQVWKKQIKHQSAGQHEINVDLSKHSSGVYFYRLEAGSFVQTKKMVFLK